MACGPGNETEKVQRKVDLVMAKEDKLQKGQDLLAAAPIYPLILREFAPGSIAIHNVPAGTCISDAANEGYHILYLLEGTIKVWSLSNRGKRVLLDEVRAMSFCGHISRLQGHCFDSNLVTHTRCSYLEFTDEQFLRLMEHSDFALEFYRSTSKRAYYMFHKFLGLSLFTAEENTAMYCTLHPERLSAYTLDQISEEIGISRRSLCYTLNHWRKQGIIEKKRNKYEIVDVDALRQLASQIQLFYH